MDNGKNNGESIVAIQTDAAHAAECLIGQVQDELKRLLAQRTEIMKRIGTVKKTISGLCALLGNDVASEEVLQLVGGSIRGRQAGFTQACRTILMEADGVLTAQEVRGRILAGDPTLLSRHKDLLASITTILNRLVHYGEAVKVSNAHGQAWRWSSEAPIKPDLLRGSAV